MKNVSGFCVTEPEGQWKTYKVARSTNALSSSSLMRPIKAVSSANLMMGHFELCDQQSDVYSVNRNGANTVPRGSPVLEEITFEILD